MTAFCLSSTSRSRPLAFTACTAHGLDENVPEPVPPGLIVDTSVDEPADQLPANAPSSSSRPDAKHPSARGH
jgi:hypothetical protein